MSFSVSNGVITQTGTDTDLSGLSGISGVTVLNEGDVSIYQMSGVQLLIDGDLSIDPKTERLFFLANQPSTYAVRLNTGGTLTIGTDANAPSYSEGLWLQTTRKATTGYAGTQVSLDARGTLILYGGTMDVSAMVSVRPTSLTCEGQRVFLRATNSQNARFKTDNSVLYENFYLYGNGIQVGGGTIGAPTFNNITIDNATTIGVNPCFDGQVIENFDYIKKGSIYPWNNASTSTNKTVISRNHAKGTSGGTNTFEFGSPTTQSQLVIVCTRHLDFNVKTTSGSNLQGVKISTIERDNSGTNYSDWAYENDDRNLTLAGTDYSTPLATTVTTSANGDASIDDFRFAIAFQYNNGTRTRILSRFTKSADDSDTHDFYYFKYGYLIGSTDIGLAGKDRLKTNLLMVTDLSITESNKATVDAYSEIDTPQKFYDRASSYLEDNYARQASALVTLAGNSIDAGSYNVEVDANASSVFAISGNTLTIKATRFVGNIATTGTATLSNGAEVIGTFGSTTVLPWEVKNVEATTRLQLYNLTKDALVITQKLSGTAGTYVDATGTYDQTEISVGDVVRLRCTCVVATEAMLPVETTGVATSTGITFQVDQVADEVYNANGINGSTVEKTDSNSSGTLVADYASPMGVDVSDADGTASVKEIYAFFVYSTTTEDGVDKWFGGMRAIDNANYEIVTARSDIKIQNIGTNAVVVSDGRLFRDDSTSVLYAENGDKPISMDSGALTTNVQPMVESALNANAKVNSIDKNTKIIPALL